jgi:predicted O-linked N-acetylglucosamine transferase (SPINDLY family)
MNNLIKSYLAQGSLIEAAECATALIDRDSLSLLELVEIAEVLGRAGHSANLIALYKNWLARSSDGNKFIAFFNLGVLLADSGDHAAAAECCRSALDIKPDFIQARINLGRQLESLGQIPQAVLVWQETVDLLGSVSGTSTEHLVLTLNNMGRVLEQAGHYHEAESALAKSLHVRPDQPDVIQHWVHLRQKQCKWPVYQASQDVSAHAMLTATSPLAMLSQADDPALQLLASRTFVQRKLTLREDNLAAGKSYRHKKLRIGYLGGNLCVHAVGLLLADIFEHQDHGRFESFAFCYSPEDGTAYRQRLLASFDHVERVGPLTDVQLAQKILECEIDVLVDLHGLSDGVRAGVLALRPAPVQVTYLGFIGPTALPYLDYVVADRFSLPENLLPYFSEKPLYLPQALLPLSKRQYQGATRTRAEFGLPEKGFVFANFNNTYKMNAAMFGSWMRILSGTDGSVLWLLDDKADTTNNLRREAEKYGVSRDRLIFAGRVAVADYLARFTLADLFLDTYPYNAGSTACDALGMGLPILTLSGKTFVSRMAGALLDAAGLPELIANTHERYEAQAINLARDNAQLSKLRLRLDEALQNSPATDPAQYMKAFEKLLLQADAEKAANKM